MNNLIRLLQYKQLVWHANAQPQPAETCQSGYPELDLHLNGGLNRAGVIELISDIAIGELRLILPTLSQVPDKLLVLISPPADVYGPALAASGINLKNLLVIRPDNQTHALWAAEQCLSSGCCHSVLFWPQAALVIHQIKRFQLACEKGQSRQILFRPQRQQGISLPLDLSLSLTATRSGLSVQVNKRKGGWPSDPFELNMQTKWPYLVKPEINQNIIPFPVANTG